MQNLLKNNKVRQLDSAPSQLRWDIISANKMKVLALVLLLFSICLCMTSSSPPGDADTGQHHNKIECHDYELRRSLNKLLSQLKNETLMW